MVHAVQGGDRVHGVIFGCRREDGRWLMVRRSALVPLPLKVCFPGGGVMAGETPEAACVREAREELGVSVVPVRAVWRHEFEERGMWLTGFLAELAPGPIRPEPLEIAEVLWLSRAEALAHPDGLATNRMFIDALEGAAGELFDH